MACALLNGPVEGRQGDDAIIPPTSNEFLGKLTEQERSWLSEHPTISLAHDPEWPPVEFSDARGELSGMSGDYIHLVEQRLGLKFVRIPNLSWQETFARQKRWEIDMATCVAETAERTNFWAFTKPYLSIPIVIATQLNVPYIANMKELFGKKVALVKGYAIDDWITKDLPEINLVRTNTALEGLKMLQGGEVFAYIDNLLIIGDYQAKMKVTSIKIAGQTPYENAQRMAVRKDWAPLAGILQKALDSISETERHDIYRKWLPVRYEHGFNYTLLWQVLAVLTLLFFALALWNRKLVMEIRARKRAEEERHKAEKSLRHANLVVENSPVVVFRWQAVEGWPVVMVSENVSQFGYSREELLAGLVPFASMVHPDDLQRVGREVQEYSTSGTDRFAQEYRMVTKDGEVRWVDDRTLVERNDDGLITFYQGIVIDITERKRVEEALRESEKKYQSLFGNAQVALFRTNISDGKLLEINERYAKMAGYANVGDCMAEFNAADAWADPSARIDLRRIMLEKGYVTDYEAEIIRRDGAHIWILFSATVFPEPGFFEGSIVDITERKQAEAALRSSLAEKDSLLKEVHHRVKNNLQIISSLLSLQGRKVQNREALDLLQDAQNRVRSMALLHETLYRSGNLARVDFPQYVKSICSHLVRSCAGNAENIRLRQDIADVALDMDQAIPAGLIISELVTNALKHAFPARAVGEISVELQVAGEKNLVLRVSDNGVGLPAATRSQSSATLGLTLVKNLSRQLDGQLSIEGEQGTVFEIVFPSARSFEMVNSMKKTRILIVEDETIVAMDIQDRLTELGYEVTGVADRGNGSAGAGSLHPS